MFAENAGKKHTITNRIGRLARIIPSIALLIMLSLLPGMNISPTISQAQEQVDITALVAEGDQLTLQSLFEEAEAKYGDAVRAAPDDPLPYARWSRLLAFDLRATDAAAKAQMAAQVDIANAEAYARLARARDWQGRYDEALMAAQQAVTLDPNYAEGYAFLAEVYLDLGLTGQAETQANKALQLDPNNAEAHRSKAFLLAAQNDLQGAIEEAEEAAQLEPLLWLRFDDLATMLRLIGDYEQAITFYQYAIDLRPKATSYTGMGLSRVALNQLPQAQALLQKAVNLDPDNPEAQAALGLVYAQMGQCTQAQPYIQQALRLDPDVAMAQQAQSLCGETALSVVATATPTNVPTAEAPAAPPVQPTAQQVNLNPVPTSPTCGPITGFENFGTWRRGDEPFGTFTQSNAQAHSGSFSGALSYNFPTGGNDYVVFMKTYPLGGHGNQITVWVYGDGSGHFINCWIRDAGKEIWQFSFGQVTHSGWQQMAASLSVPQPWPGGHVSGPANGTVDYPIEFYALVLDDAPDTYSGSGTLYIDDLACSEEVTAPPAPQPAAQPPVPPAEPQPAPQPQPQGPASIQFWADKESVPAGECTKIHWAVDNVREVYLDGEGVTGHGEKRVCPTMQKYKYTLHVIKVDGSTEDRQVTIKPVGSIIVDPPAPPGGGSWGQIKADLTITDLFLQGEDQGATKGEVWLTFENNGPDDHNDSYTVTCSAKAYKYCTYDQQSSNSNSFTRSGNWSAKDFEKYTGTGLQIDTDKYWYKVECSISSRLADPNPGNNTFDKSFASKRCP